MLKKCFPGTKETEYFALQLVFKKENINLKLLVPWIIKKFEEKTLAASFSLALMLSLQQITY